MRLLRMAIVALIATGFWSAPALGCAFDLDCSIGSKCYKPSGSLYGWCVGGMSPGNSNDKKPAYDPMDLTGKKAIPVLSILTAELAASVSKIPGSTALAFD